METHTAKLTHKLAWIDEHRPAHGRCTCGSATAVAGVDSSYTAAQIRCKDSEQLIAAVFNPS